TLGFRLDKQEEIGAFRYDESARKIDSFVDYAKALVRALMQVQQNTHLHSDDWERTVYIDTLKIDSTDFDISTEDKLALIQQGVSGAQNYLEWFEDPTKHPKNRIEPSEAFA